jgi:hypothetical protein
MPVDLVNRLARAVGGESGKGVAAGGGGRWDKGGGGEGKVGGGSLAGREGGHGGAQSPT